MSDLRECIKKQREPVLEASDATADMRGLASKYLEVRKHLGDIKTSTATMQKIVKRTVGDPDVSDATKKLLQSVADLIGGVEKQAAALDKELSSEFSPKSAEAYKAAKRDQQRAADAKL